MFSDFEWMCETISGHLKVLHLTSDNFILILGVFINRCFELYYNLSQQILRQLCVWTASNLHSTHAYYAVLFATTFSATQFEYRLFH